MRLDPRKNKRGQAMTEFVIVAGVIVAVAIMTVAFLLTFHDYGTRVLDLVGSEYP